MEGCAPYYPEPKKILVSAKLLVEVAMLSNRLEEHINEQDVGSRNKYFYFGTVVPREELVTTT